MGLIVYWKVEKSVGNTAVVWGGGGDGIGCLCVYEDLG